VTLEIDRPRDPEPALVARSVQHVEPLGALHAAYLQLLEGRRGLNAHTWLCRLRLGRGLRRLRGRCLGRRLRQWLAAAVEQAVVGQQLLAHAAQVCFTRHSASNARRRSLDSVGVE
jgi:hypothetical protein